jgi:hypothetical protein
LIREDDDHDGGGDRTDTVQAERSTDASNLDACRSRWRRNLLRQQIAPPVCTVRVSSSAVHTGAAFCVPVHYTAQVNKKLQLARYIQDSVCLQEGRKEGKQE